MKGRWRGSIAVFAALLASLLVVPVAHGFVLGIGDQKADMFTDARFATLGVKHARLAVPWDVLHYGWQVDQVDAWLQAARDHGVEPLITFSHSRGAGRHRILPTPSRFAIEFRRFRARYPWVRNYATWNEANHCGEPTCHRPALVAAYYRRMVMRCPNCRVLAAELLDERGMVPWVRAFKSALGREPAYWGLHNYLDANHLTTTGTRRLLDHVTGKVWFTEVGGIVNRRNRSNHRFTQSAAHAATVTRFVLSRLARLSPRIERVYIYHWDIGQGVETWDSALIGPTGAARPAYRVLRSYVSAEAVRTARARARARAVRAQHARAAQR